MTYTYDFYFGKTDSSDFMEKNKLVVEYVLSSVSNEIKIVEMTRHGEDAFGVFGEQRHCISWFSEEGRDRLFMELDEEFHHLLCQGVSFPRAWRVIQAVKGQLDRMRFIGLPQPGHAVLMLHQHSVILDAIRNGLPDDAANEMAKHLNEIWGSIERITLDESEFLIN